MNTITVETHANIALHKYWGKRDEKLFLPTKSSFSFALAELTTRALLSFSDKHIDHIELAWNLEDRGAQKSIVNFFDLVRERHGIDAYFSLKTENNFPTASGLASSSSGFAALALGLNHLCQLNLSDRELSILARQGSGSAARSIHGGFSLWHKGEWDDGSDSYAEQIFSHRHWPELCMLVVVVTMQSKTISSREGMRLTQATSLFYSQWLEESEKRLPTLIDSVKKKDFNAVGNLVEVEWRGMYESMMTTTPALHYWHESSFEIMQIVQKIRQDGIDCFFTTDAGPHVKVLCLQDDVKKIKPLFEQVRGVIKVIVGTGADNPLVYEAVVR